jgi:hypothetical protein
MAPTLHSCTTILLSPIQSVYQHPTNNMIPQAAQIQQ